MVETHHIAVKCLHVNCAVTSPLTLQLCSKHFGEAVELDLLDEVRERIGMSKPRKQRARKPPRVISYAPVKTVLGRRAPAGAPLAFLMEHSEHSGAACLIWPFGRYENGYGAIIYKDRQTIAHRVMCRVAHGEPPVEEFDASHTCQNGHLGCVNPRHLVWESHYDNHQRRVKNKARQHLRLVA